jgi:hypothetical protein
MSGPARLSALGIALLGVSVAACAGIVGADFSDVHGTSGSGISIDGGNVVQGDDSGKPPNTSEDSGQPIIVAEGGVCPANYTNCGGDCFDLKSDPGNCNSCGHVCPLDPSGKGGPACLSGSCTFSCPDPYELCGGSATIGCCLPTTPDAGKDSGPTTDPGIVCGSATTYCPIQSGGFCCADNQEGAGGDICANANTPDDSVDCVYVLYCSSSGECAAPSGACCYDTNDYDPQGDTNGQTATCKTSCGGDPYIQFCNPSKSECPVGTACSGVFAGSTGNPTAANYYYCE